jgi:hypothetical protein
MRRVKARDTLGSSDAPVSSWPTRYSSNPEWPVFHASQAGIGVPARRWFDRELFLSVIAQLFDPNVVPAEQ